MDTLAPLVLGTVGTDHHPFDRLVDWLDDWLDRAQRPVRCFVQVGTSRPPTRAEHAQYLPYLTLEARMAQADVVVCHAGPGTIMLAIAAGRRPIVVPRRRDLGEHVDDHQVVFARHIAREGTIMLVETQHEFDERVAEALERPTAAASAGGHTALSDTVARFEALVGPLLHRSRAGGTNGVR